MQFQVCKTVRETFVWCNYYKAFFGFSKVGLLLSSCPMHLSISASVFFRLSFSPRLIVLYYFWPMSLTQGI